MRSIEKDSSREFVVLNLTDVHMSSYEWDPARSYAALFTNTLRELVERTKPDLITITGDLSWAGDLVSYEKTAAVIESYGIPWAPVWGNHDQQEGPEVLKQEAEIFSRCPHCIYEEGDPALGGGNYVIRIEEQGKPVYALIMMNSNDHSPWIDGEGNEKSEWAHLETAQLQWYSAQVEMLGDCRNAVLMHIPIYAYRDACKAAFGEDNTLQPGFEGVTGTCLEGICSYPEDRNEFEIFKKSGTTEFMLAGHDHTNDFMIPWQGITLAYAVKMAAGCYWNPKKSGGTVLRIGADGLRAEQVYVDPEKYVDVREFEKK